MKEEASSEFTTHHLICTSLNLNKWCTEFKNSWNFGFNISVCNSGSESWACGRGNSWWLIGSINFLQCTSMLGSNNKKFNKQWNLSHLSWLSCKKLLLLLRLCLKTLFTLIAALKNQFISIICGNSLQFSFSVRIKLLSSDYEAYMRKLSNHAATVVRETRSADWPIIELYSSLVTFGYFPCFMEQRSDRRQRLLFCTYSVALLDFYFFLISSVETT